MNTFNPPAELDIPDDDDDFADVEGRPLVGWFLMAVALVAMAFLIGSGPEASAHPVRPEAPAPAVSALAPLDLAFGG